MKLKNPFFKGRRLRRSPYLSTLTFTKSNLPFMFYFVTFVVLPVNKYTNHFGPYFASVSLKEFTSYKVRSLYEGALDGNWRAYPRARIYFNKEKLTRTEKLQLFSLIKIFEKRLK